MAANMNNFAGMKNQDLLPYFLNDNIAIHTLCVIILCTTWSSVQKNGSHALSS
jgi:hypothetical protein